MYKIEVLNPLNNTWKTFQDRELEDGYCRWETYMQADKAVRLLAQDMPYTKFRVAAAELS